MAILSRRFFDRSVAVVARELLGCRLRLGGVAMQITEVEAYGGAEDSASHARFGRSGRSAPMWGPPGRAYVYLCYGVHNMLNVVTDGDGRASAVLIRACEPVAGLDTILERRGVDSPTPSLLAGPGKVGQALGLDTSWSGHPLHRPGGLTIRSGEPPRSIVCGHRIGIEFAAPADRTRRWRFAIADSPAVTQPKRLTARAS